MIEPSVDQQYGPLPQGVTVTVQRRGNVLVIVVVGDLAADTMVGLEPLVTALPPGVRQVVVDLAGVDFLDGAGLRALLHARHVCLTQGATFTVQDPGVSSRYLMALTETTGLLLPGGPTRAAVNEQQTGPGDQEEAARL
jgi:anti-sigma B factor antagonist